VSSTLQSVTELKLYIAQKYILAAEERFGNWINLICNIITNSSDGDIMSRISRAVYAMVGTDTCSNTTADRAIGRQFTLDESSMLAWKWQVKISLSNFSLFNIKNKFTFLKIKIIFIKISNFLMYNYYIY